MEWIYPDLPGSTPDLPPDLPLDLTLDLPLVRFSRGLRHVGTLRSDKTLATSLRLSSDPPGKPLPLR